MSLGAFYLGKSSRSCLCFEGAELTFIGQAVAMRLLGYTCISTMPRMPNCNSMQSCDRAS